ncbi:hypothetical protein MIDIC_510010 [Alphaproteobacteria bacterium]
MIDSTIIRAHQHAAGARKRDIENGTQTGGRSKGRALLLLNYTCSL